MITAPIERVQIGFSKLTDLELLDRATIIETKLYGNTSFPAPPIKAEDYTAQVDDYRQKLANRPSGGPGATAAKNESRAKLTATLKQLGMYVQVASDNVLSVLLSSGFESVSTNRTSEPLPTPQISQLIHGQTGEILLTCRAITNARGYEREIALVSEDGSFQEFRNIGFSKGARRLSTTGLVPAKRYAFRIRAMGGSTDQSDWSEPATIICL